MSQPRSSMLLSLILAILAFSSIGLTYPITSTHIPRSQLHARAASPRVIPHNSDELRNSIMNDIFDSIGLNALGKLNQWKQKLESSDLIDDSHSVNSTVTAHYEVVVSDTSKALNEDHKPGVVEPTQDPMAFVAGVFSSVSSKITQMFNSQDEITLGA